jgi:hypothetical protein
MMAIVQDTYGSADVRQLRDVDVPVVGDGDVLGPWCDIDVNVRLSSAMRW